VRAATALLGALALAAAAGCGSQRAGAEQDARQEQVQVQVQVQASFYPLQWLAERIGGEDVSVVGLTPAGTEPHDLELSPRARTALDDADVVLHLGQGFQPGVERALATVDGAAEVDLLESPGLDTLPAPTDLGKEPLSGGQDPHVWLDPVRMKVMAAAVAAAMVDADPALQDAVAARLQALQRDLEVLDSELAAAVADCRRRTVVTSHAAFGYLADRYDLEQVAIAGLSADDEPDPATLRTISRTAERAGVTTVFFEEALPPTLAETVAAEIGARTDLLGALEFDPSQALGADQDYLSVQRRNGESLRRGLDCSP
jgi:zinc transport system substrate-binding protein